MANKILKGLRLPGGKDTYIITPETAKDLNTPNAAAESKMVGDELAKINNNLNLKADKTETSNQLSLKADKIETSNQLNLKADKAETSNQLNLKADKAEVNTNLNLKADKIETDNKLNLKANKTEVEQSLSFKADISYVNNKTNALIFKEKTITLLANEWKDSTQTVNLEGITTESKIISTPAPTLNNIQIYNDSLIFCEKAQQNQLIYKCETLPATDVTINLLYN